MAETATPKPKKVRLTDVLGMDADYKNIQYSKDATTNKQH